MTPKVKAVDATQSVIAVAMQDGGMEEAEAKARAAEKVKQSTAWMRRAGFFVGLCFLFVGVGIFVVAKVVLGGGTVPVLVAVIFAVAAGLAFAVALFCAVQASAEVVNTWFSFLFKLNRAVRGKEEPTTEHP